MSAARPAAGAATAAPCSIVIFGASGDLAKRKLLPALYSLTLDGLLSPQSAIVGVATGDLDAERFRDKMGADVRALAPRAFDPDVWATLAPRLHYVRGAFESEATFAALAGKLTELAQAQGGTSHVCYYLAVAPRFFGPIVAQLARAGLLAEGPDRWRRVIVEKPFGRDLQSARALNVELSQLLAERQIYRIDHYLGKETVQNLMVLRFGNGVFEPVWNRRYVDHVQITAAETVGVETRAAYYETAGALRDMVPNHLCQLLSLAAMEPPASFDANAVRNEQVKVLEALQPFTHEDVLTRAVRGQYGGAAEMRGYRGEPGVAPESSVETYAAMRLSIDNWRWAGVPFYLRTGKRLTNRVTEIVIQFRRAPFALFRRSGAMTPTQNRLVIRIQPDESVALTVGAKQPGAVMRQRDVDMRFTYAEQFGPPGDTGYERLLYDCMLGDQTLFQRSDMVEAGWGLIQPVLDVWSALPGRGFPNYASGSRGPSEADQLLEREHRAWHATP